MVKLLLVIKNQKSTQSQPLKTEVTVLLSPLPTKKITVPMTHHTRPLKKAHDLNISRYNCTTLSFIRPPPQDSPSGKGFSMLQLLQASALS